MGLHPSGGVWTQQGNKLVDTGGSGLGFSVSLSGNGNTAIIGASLAPWVYTRSGGIWTQGNKLFGSGAVGDASQGASVSLSRDGNTAIVGGPGDNSNAGAAWVFVQLSKDDCKNRGWLNFPSPPGPFTNQGQCVSYFAKQK